MIWILLNILCLWFMDVQWCSSWCSSQKKEKISRRCILIYVLTYCPFECHFHVENDDGIFGGGASCFWQRQVNSSESESLWVVQPLNKQLSETFQNIDVSSTSVTLIFPKKQIYKCQTMSTSSCPKPWWKISRGLHKTGKDSGSHVRTCGQRPVVQIKSACIPSSKTLKFAKGQSQLLWREFQFMNCYDLFMNYSWVQRAGHSTLLSMMHQTRGFWGCKRFRRTAKAPKM